MALDGIGRSASRRQLLTVGFCGVLAGWVSPSAGRDRPPAIGRKFYPDGRVRRWPGNTIISFARTDSDLWQALAEMQGAARVEPVMESFALLPTPSLHMTVFAGIDDEHRRRPYWPASLAPDTSLAGAQAWCRQRLTGFRAGGGRFRMRIERPAPGSPVKDFSVHVSPADGAEADRLRDLRRRLSERLQIAPPHLDEYRFHITLGYLIDWLRPQQSDTFARLYETWLLRVVGAVPEFSIGPPTLCDFEDMFSFKPVLVLPD